MKKGLIIALAAVLVLGLSGAAMAWNVNISGTVTDASGGIWGDGGAVCTTGTPPLTLDYDFSSALGVIDAVGSANMSILGNGTPGQGSLTTTVYGLTGSEKAAVVFANQHVEALVCQGTECCDPEIEFYVGDSSVRAEDAQAYIQLKEVTGQSGPFSGKNPTTEQTLDTYGFAGGQFDAHMTATKVSMGVPESHTMGVYGENVEFDVEAYQGMDSTCSAMYGFLGDYKAYYCGCHWYDVAILQYGPI